MSHTTYEYEVHDPGEAVRDEWCETVEELPVTHVVRYQPCFRIEVKLPPWVDPDAWLAEASMGWNDWLCDAGEAWTEPGGYAWMEIVNEGSSQGIVDRDSGGAA
ncbi:MAG: hypothetical protein LC750_07610 [Actinobacteria bacterium]|nr:hypothetical protein [Actinomycetota bacterium]